MTKLLKQIALLVFIFFASIEVYADTLASQKLQGILGSIQSMQGKFSQTIYNNHGKVIRVSRGTMALAKPGYFRWDITSPVQQNIISDANKVWVYDVDLKQVRVKSAKGSNASPVMLISNSGQELLRLYTVSADEDENFQLKAKYRDNPFTQIQLEFNGNHLSKMRLTDNLGQQSVLVFSEIRTNAAIAQNLFHFDPPAGVDVVQES